MTSRGQTLAGQNQDISPAMDAFGIVLHLIPSDGRPRVATFTFAGQLGYMGASPSSTARQTLKPCSAPNSYTVYHGKKFPEGVPP